MCCQSIWICLYYRILYSDENEADLKKLSFSSYVDIFWWFYPSRVGLDVVLGSIYGQNKTKQKQKQKQKQTRFKCTFRYVKLVVKMFPGNIIKLWFALCRTYGWKDNCRLLSKVKWGQIFHQRPIYMILNHISLCLSCLVRFQNCTIPIHLSIIIEYYFYNGN